MNLTFLGTGGAFTDFRENYHNNALLEIGPRMWVMLDCGGTAVQSIKELGVKPWEIAAVVVTHLHGDHIGGIEQLMWERYYTGPHGPSFWPTRLWTTTDIMPKLRQVLEPCVDEYTSPRGVAQGGFEALTTPTVVRPGEALWMGSVGLRLDRTPHVEGPGVSKMSYGVHMTAEGGATAYYTSDTVFRANIGALYPRGLIFHDCTFSPAYPGTVHTHYEQLRTLPEDVRARVVLMHHTSVPPGIDVCADGFKAAAHRHDVFTF